MSGQEKRAWLYSLAWLGGGIAAGWGVWHLIGIFTHGPWAEGTQAQRLGILGEIATSLLILMGLVTLGLSLRNAIRNIKGSAGPVSFEASGQADAAAVAVASAAVDKADEIIERGVGQ